MRQFLRSLACLATFAATPLAAQDSPVVVELYTSQGCSSCPPADEMLAELATRDNVIALALHVDYWDYIGWVDKFASPDHTRRQKDYARAAGHTTIYTPQFVIGGQDFVIGAKGMKLADTIQAHSQVMLPVAVEVSRTGSDLMITARMQSPGGADGPFVIQLAQIIAGQTVDIQRGENAGRTMSYSNVVRSLEVVHQWDGSDPVQLTTQVVDADAIAVIVQQGTNGAVVGAAQLN